jgi:HAD superfamily hydrolase (TIGR01509 family)
MVQTMKDLLADKETILFDLDGTLVQSNELHASAWAEVLQRFGHEITAEQVWPLIGKGADKLLPELTGIAADSPEGKEIIAARTRTFIEHYVPRVRAVPCAKELVDHLRKQGKKIMIASSAAEEELQAILRAAELEDCIPERTASDDADTSKPDPDIVTAALRKVGSSADQAVMIGDTPYDVEAARRAGLSIIAFRCGGWSDEDFEGANFVCEGPEELLIELCRTPESSALYPTPPAHGELTL